MLVFGCIAQSRIMTDKNVIARHVGPVQAHSGKEGHGCYHKCIRRLNMFIKMSRISIYLFIYYETRAKVHEKEKNTRKHRR